MPTTVRGMVRLIVNHPANQGRRVRALASAVRWQAWKRLVGRAYDLRVYDDLRFRAYPDSTQPGRFIYFGGLPDYEEMTFMKRYLRPGDGFVDGGANEGMYTLLAGKLVGPAGAVHAFEAVPRYLRRLAHNVAANGQDCVSIHANAVGDKPGEVPFLLRGTGSRIQTVRERGSTVSVEVVRLDDVLPDRPYAMGKLDVEGAEALVLAGAEKLLGRGEPMVWMVEVVDHMLARFGSSEEQFRRWLADRGYDLMRYDPAGNRLAPAPDPLHPLSNALAVCRARRHEVEQRLQSG